MIAVNKKTTIAKLPEKESMTVKVSDKEKDAALLALIKKGGRSARPDFSEEEKVSEKRISLRIPEDIVERIRQAAKARPIRMPRHSWIVEAILEKLDKESF